MNFRACAKVNLSLEVYASRADGYHDLRSVVLPVSLCDELTLEPAADFSSDTGYGEADLCVRAARFLARRHGRSEAATFRIVKRIPVGGGLGGGSADAAAVLLALNRAWGLGLPLEELAAAGAHVGSDVPALVLAMGAGCPVLMEGRGERVSRLTVGDLPPGFLPSRHLVLVNPGVSASTVEVYRACRARVDAPRGPVNDLQEPACRLYPEIACALALLAELGANGVRMSGSGSTVFGFAPSSAAAAAVVREVQGRGLTAWSVSPLTDSPLQMPC